jgi:integrase
LTQYQANAFLDSLPPLSTEGFLDMARHRNIVPKVNVTQNDNGTWSCWWAHDGKVIRRGCDGAETEKKAREVAERRFREWQNPPPPPAWTVGQLLDEYIRYKTETGPEHERAASPSFLDNFKQVRPFFAGYTAKLLGPDAWNAYRKHRRAMHVRNAGARAAKANGKPPKFVGDATAIRELNALRGALLWGKVRRWVGLESFDTKTSMRLTNQETNPRHEFLTRAEFARLLGVVQDTLHLDLFCRLSVATGARMSAVLDRQWSDVTWPVAGRDGPLPIESKKLFKVGERSGEVLSLPITMTAPDGRKHVMTHSGELTLMGPIEISFGEGRGNKKRPAGLIGPSNLPLWLALAHAYEKRNPACPYIISFRGKGVKSVDLSDAFERAKIPQPKRTQHVLKHTCCSWLVQAGVSYIKIAKLVGTSADTIERYYGHLSPEHLATVGDNLSV